MAHRIKPKTIYNCHLFTSLFRNNSECRFLCISPLFSLFPGAHKSTVLSTPSYNSAHLLHFMSHIFLLADAVHPKLFHILFLPFYYSASLRFFVVKFLVTVFPAFTVICHAMLIYYSIKVSVFIIVDLSAYPRFHRKTSEQMLHSDYLLICVMIVYFISHKFSDVFYY